MNIYQKINEVMKKVTYIQKDASIDGKYKAVTHDNVAGMVRPEFIKQGIIIEPTQLSSKIETRIDKSAKPPVNMLLYSAEYAVSFVNIDKPEDRVTVVIHSHATDNQDKAPGKAISYAVKYATLKILCMETGENEESRHVDPYTIDEQEEMNRYIDAWILNPEKAIEMGEHTSSVVFQQKMRTRPEAMTALFNSFEKGSITKRKDALRDINQCGWNVFKTINAMVKNNQDYDHEEIKEAVADLNREEKKVLAGMLSEQEQFFLKQLKEGE